MKKKDKPTREQKYSVVYWPAAMLDQKMDVYDLLLDIDCNFSRFLQSILHNLSDICKLIISMGKNFRHYSWHLLIIDNKTGDGYSSLKSGTYDLINLVEGKAIHDGTDKENQNEES